MTKIYTYSASDPSSDYGTSTVIVIASNTLHAKRLLKSQCELMGRMKLLPQFELNSVDDFTSGVLYSTLEAR